MAVAVNGLADAVMAALQEFETEATEAVKESVVSAADACLASVKANSPKDSGDYQKGWRVKKVYEGEHDMRVRVYNKDHYQLTHLLEKGHALRGGGRAQAFEHIGPVAEWVDENLTNIIKSNIEKEN
jgi:hypothetical protein